MASPIQQPTRRRRWRHRARAVAVALFPLLVAGGLMAPGIVRVLALAADPGEETKVAGDRSRLGPLERHPLLVPRDFSAGFIPELLDLDQLFRSTNYRDRSLADRLARIMSFARNQGDLIVIDDLGVPVLDIAFKDALADDLVADLGPIDEDGWLPLCGTLYAGNCVRDDDFLGGGGTPGLAPPVPIPEPGTASLLALGLGALGIARRINRSRG